MAAERRIPRGQPARAAARRRCWWAETADADYVRYHDEEWGRPVHDDRRLFEMLTLEGAQAGLSWSTILRKRAGYRRAFANFNVRRVAHFDARRRAALLNDAAIVRNRLKIDSTVTNARAFLAVQREFGSFDRYLWSFAGGRTRVNCPRHGQVPARTALSDALSKDLARRGFRFVGSTIIYAFLQAVGVVNDHTRDCYLCPPLRSGRAGSRRPSRPVRLRAHQQ
ncbi:MAG TPA: DNA-3-methyladenine glycosylase I [Steroidobacteraceae bacterium]|jgi:DNA-3-methyladenine glycosylase I|nr:DNA-3-methyladenine glycosylase I [Steroidobacteraceae bacterium]